MQGPWVLSQVRKIPLEKEMETTPVFLSGKFMDRGACQAIVQGVEKGLGITSWLNNNNKNK